MKFTNAFAAFAVATLAGTGANARSVANADKPAATQPTEPAVTQPAVTQPAATQPTVVGTDPATYSPTAPVASSEADVAEELMQVFKTHADEMRQWAKDHADAIQPLIAEAHEFMEKIKATMGKTGETNEEKVKDMQKSIEKYMNDPTHEQQIEKLKGDVIEFLSEQKGEVKQFVVRHKHQILAWLKEKQEEVRTGKFEQMCDITEMSCMEKMGINDPKQQQAITEHAAEIKRQIVEYTATRDAFVATHKEQILKLLNALMQAVQTVDANTVVDQIKQTYQQGAIPVTGSVKPGAFVGADRGSLPPAYLSVTGFEQCMGKQAVGTTTVWCLPKEHSMVPGCEAAAWSALTSLNSIGTAACGDMATMPNETKTADGAAYSAGPPQAEAPVGGDIDVSKPNQTIDVKPNDGNNTKLGTVTLSGDGKTVNIGRRLGGDIDVSKPNQTIDVKPNDGDNTKLGTVTLSGDGKTVHIGRRRLRGSSRRL